MHDFKKLDVWKKSMDLAAKIYELTKSFPDDEKYGLTSQLRRCSISIPSNIAEGAGRSTNKSFSNFLSIALGSVFELETQILLSKRLNFLQEEAVNTILVEVESIGKMLNALMKRFSKD